MPDYRWKSTTVVPREDPPLPSPPAQHCGHAPCITVADDCHLVVPSQGAHAVPHVGSAYCTETQNRCEYAVKVNKQKVYMHAHDGLWRSKKRGRKERPQAWRYHKKVAWEPWRRVHQQARNRCEYAVRFNMQKLHMTACSSQLGRSKEVERGGLAGAPRVVREPWRWVYMPAQEMQFPQSP